MAQMMITAETRTTTLTLDATATAVEAAAPANQTDAVRFRGVAYRGDIMNTRGYDSGVVIDLAGLTIPEAVPIALDHQRTVDTRLGTAEARVERHELIVEGTIVPGSPGADRAIALLRAGGCSLSIAVSVQAIEVAAPNGDTVVNGRALAGGTEIARRGVLREISVVGVGADHGAHAIAASGMEADMNEETDGAVLAEREKVVTEQKRIEEINAAFHGIDNSDNLRMHLVTSGASASEARARALDLLRHQRKTETGNVSGLSLSGSRSAFTPELMLGAAVMQLTGDIELGEKEYGERAMQAAEDLRITSMLDLCQRSLELTYQDVPRSRDKMIQAAFSTVGLPEVLGDSLGKRAAAALVEAEEPWRDIAHEVLLNSFREHKFVRMNGQLQLEEVPPAGAITHGTLGEEFSVLRASTYGKMIVLTRQSIIDDDLGMFLELPRMMGYEAARLVGDMLYDVLQEGDEGNGGSFFTTARGNRLAGSSTGLSVSSLSLAIASMRKQRDAGGRPLNMPPKALLVSPDLEHTARSIINSSELGTTDGAPRGNPMKGIAELYVDARLGANEWFLFGPKRNAAVQVGFVNGQNRPTIESKPTDFNTLGTGWRVYWDVAVGLHEYRAAVYSLGEVEA